MNERCDRCGSTGELRRHVLTAEPCPHCLTGENVAHRSPILSDERICRACFDAIRDERMAKLKAQAEPNRPLEGDEVSF